MTSLDLRELPKEISHLVKNRKWQAATSGQSRSKVFRLEGGLYLKTLLRQPHDEVFGTLVPERDRLDWLKGRLGSPALQAFAQDQHQDYLVISEVAGLAAVPEVGQHGLPWLVQAIANGCRALHELPITHCPFSYTNKDLIEQAQDRLHKNLVDVDNFDAERIGRSASNLFDELVASRPSYEDLVFTHGDLDLENIIIKNNKVAGFVDLGLAGIGDRWRDLALCTKSIRSDLGPQWVEPFLKAYGTSYEPEKAHFYRLVYEFF